MSHNKPVLLVGGPADGTRITVSADSRIFNSCARGLPDNEYDATPGGDDPNYDHPGAGITTYALQTVQGADHRVFCIGVMDLSLCIAHALVAGYRKPKAHPSDMSVAAQLVTLLGGDSDGHQMVISDHHTQCAPYHSADNYEIITLPCKGGAKIRVGVLDITADPLPMLIAGYRFEGSK